MNISDAIRQIALRGCEMYLSICTVDAVDEETRTIDCTPIDEGAQLLGVNLQANQGEKVGLVSIPAVGSEVVVGFINPAVAVVVLAMELSKTIITVGDTEINVADNAVSLVTRNVKADISCDTLKLDVNGTSLEMDGNRTVWNGGSETTANATILKQELTRMSTRIDGIIQAITTAAVSPSPDGGALYKTNMATIVSALTKENFSQIIDDKIRH